MDAPTKALIEVIGDSGVTVQLYAANGQHVIEAVNQRTGEAFVVRGDDLYTVVVELAQQVGIELKACLPRFTTTCCRPLAPGHPGTPGYAAKRPRQGERSRARESCLK